MTQGKDRGLAKRQAEDRELMRRLDVMEAERMVKEMPARERTRKRVVVGDRTFSMKDMVDEIRAGSAYGECFRGVVAKMRLAKLRATKS